ncbi:hypothetical protein ACNAW0_14675 [Micromonospora sp. SL1-18]|uniref:hypothetical protein n=1 Tax=Micromonospora sp. SL1-18 TaxID=3399128 RepID=UPI003A4D6FCC
MAMTHDQWQAVRTTFRETGDRFAEMVCAARDPHALATVSWTVAETAAHVAALASLATHVVAPDDVPALKEISDSIPTTTCDTVADLNALTLRHFTERDLVVLAHRLRTDIGLLLRITRDLDPGQTVEWLGESRVPVCGIVAHLLNELHIHGRDIARAGRTPWEVRPEDAALFFELFLVGLTRHGYGRLLDNGEPPRERRIAVAFRSPYTTPVTLVLQRGLVAVEEPGRDSDVRLSFDPVTLNLMLFGRLSKARSVLTGKVVIGGRRPWLLPAFLRKLRLPS